MHGGWGAYMRYDERAAPPRADRAFLRRVARWVRPYAGRVAVMLVLLTIIAIIELVPPLIYGRLINAISQGTLTLGQLNVLAAGLLLIPLASSLLSVGQRHFSAQIGE